MKQLTQAEEEIMLPLWNLEKAFVKEVLAELPEPKPAYNTVSTILRILEKKGFVGHEAFGKSHRYYPLISEKDYRKSLTQNLVSKFFKGSGKSLVSELIAEKELDLESLDELLNELRKADGKS